MIHIIAYVRTRTLACWRARTGVGRNAVQRVRVHTHTHTQTHTHTHTHCLHARTVKLGEMLPRQARCADGASLLSVSQHTEACCRGTAGRRRPSLVQFGLLWPAYRGVRRVVQVMVVVDDASDDGSVQAAREAARADPRVRCCSMSCCSLSSMSSSNMLHILQLRVIHIIAPHDPYLAALCHLYYQAIWSISCSTVSGPYRY